MRGSPLPLLWWQLLLGNQGKIIFGHMLKRQCSIKEIKVYLLCKILILKDALQGQKNCCEPPWSIVAQIWFGSNFIYLCLDCLILITIIITMIWNRRKTTGNKFLYGLSFRPQLKMENGSFWKLWHFDVRQIFRRLCVDGENGKKSKSRIGKSPV